MAWLPFPNRFRQHPFNSWNYIHNPETKNITLEMGVLREKSQAFARDILNLGWLVGLNFNPLTHTVALR